MQITIATLATLAMFAFATNPSAADEAESQPEQHCVVDIVTQAADGQLVLSAPTCHSTFNEVASRVGLSTAATRPAEVTATQLSASTAIAIHYDGTSYTGSSLTVNSSNGQCNGGYINFRTHYTSWNNRFESLIYGCDSGPIKHYDTAPSSGGSCSGTLTQAWSNRSTLGSMNNRTSCVYYG